MFRLRTFIVLVLLPVFAAPVLAQTATPAPVVIDNCGVTITYTAAPARAVTMNQAATEIMLALGLQDRMAGTAYLDDTILPEYKAAYDSVPVLSDEYPSQEVLFGVEPDFVYGSYSSAFDPEAAGPREQLQTLGINSYVSPTACADRALRPKEVAFKDVFGEIRDIGAIFQVQERADALITRLQGQLDEVTEALSNVDQPLTVFWYDSGADEVYAGACCGAPGMIMKTLGVGNIFEDTPGSWAAVNWEDVVARNAGAIVLANASWDTAESRIDYLSSNPAYAAMTAVKNKNWVAIDFSYTTPSIRNVEAVRIIAAALYPDQFSLSNREATPAITSEATAEATAELDG